MPTETLVPFTEGDQALDVLVVRPDAPGPRPAVLVFHAWGGRKELEEDRARKLAELGYVGAAVDLYGVGRRADDRADCQALMSELTDDPARLRARITAAFDAVRATEGVDTERMAAIGFCFGGMCAILAGRMGLPLRGVVSFHGLLKLGEQLRPDVAARFVLFHGADDPMVSADEIGAFATEMQRIRAEWQLHAYPGVKHAFTNPAANDPDFGTVYDADADQRSWAEMRFVFGEILA